jgi:DNA polymerase (family X)
MKLVKNGSLKVNAELAEIFRQMAACYHYKGKNDRFRATAYENASRMLSNMEEDISIYAKNIKSLEELKGIGESIGEKIMEFLATGKIGAYEELRKEVPDELLELMNIEGFGPATVRTLHEKLNINNREELIEALGQHRLTGLKSFGEKKIANMMKVLKVNKDAGRMLLKDAMVIGNEILNEVRKIKGVRKAELAGSLRRRKETIGDIDLVVLSEFKDRKKIVNKFVSLPQVKKVLAKGTTKASVLLKKNNVQVDVRIVNDYEYGAAMLYSTGSREHNIKLRTIAKERGLKINEYGLFDTKTGKRLAGETEESMYKGLGLSYMPPEERLGKGEIERAMAGRLTVAGTM